MSINLVAKTAPVSSQIESRLLSGFENFEIQLLDSHFSINDVLSTLYEYGSQIDIVNIHTALRPDGSDITLSDVMFDERARTSFFNTCILASKLATVHDIEVIIHNDISSDYIRTHKSYGDFLCEVMSHIMSYPGVCVGVENTVALSDHNSKMVFRSGVEPMDTPYIVRYLRDRISPDRFGFVFDIGHYAIMRKLIRFLTDSCIREYISNPSMEEIWDFSDDLITTVHLSSIQGFGYGADHGKAFYEWDEHHRDFVSRIINLYDKSIKKPDLVIEVKESDYDNCWNLEYTAKTIHSVYDKLHRKSLLDDESCGERIFVYPCGVNDEK